MVATQVFLGMIVEYAAEQKDHSLELAYVHFVTKSQMTTRRKVSKPR